MPLLFRDGLVEIQNQARDGRAGSEFGDVQDLIAIVKVREHEQLADVIANRLSRIDGVVGTDTHIAFRSYSKADTDAAFAIGLD